MAGSFLKQLYLLLWKNFRLRRRQFFRNVMEIVWPLAIFIILASVRRKRMPEKMPSATQNFEGSIHYVPRALPSVGAIPFLQSWYCNYRADEMLPEPQELPKFTSSIGYKLINDIQSFSSNETQMETLELLRNNMTSLFNDVSRIVQDLNATGLLTNGTMLNPDLALSTILGDDRDEFYGFLVNVTEISPGMAQSILDTKINATGAVLLFEEYFPNVTTIPANITPRLINISRDLCDNDRLNEIFEFPRDSDTKNLTKLVCNPTFDLEVLLELAQLNVVQNYQKEFEDIQKTLVKTIPEAQSVLAEIQLLESFTSIQKIFEDIQNISSSYTLTVNNMSILELGNVICGGIPNVTISTTTTKKPVTSSSASATTTTTKTPTTTLPKILKDEIRFSTLKPKTNETCASVDPFRRVDCGWGGISDTECKRLNCCFDSSIDNAKFCFCPTTDPDSCCVKKRKLIEAVNGAGTTGNSGMQVNFISMLLSSNVLYAPENNKTRMVIKKLSSFISTFKNGLNSAYDLLENIISLLESVESNEDLLQEVEILSKELQNPSSGTKAILRLIYAQNPNYQVEVEQFINFTMQYQEYFDSAYTKKQIRLFKDYALMMQSQLKNFQGIFECYDFDNYFKPVASEKEIIAHATKDKGLGSFLSSIVFMNLPDSDDEPFPKHVEYKIRYNPDYIPSTAKIKSRYWKAGPGPRGSTSFWHFQYLNFGYVFLQDLIERSFIEILTNKEVTEPGIFVQPFPYPCYIKDVFIAGLGNSMPLFMTLAWVYTIAMIVKSIVYEKELRLKEVMKVMGLTNSVHWVAWFITSFVTMFISVIILALLLKYGNILIYSDMSVIVFILVMFTCSSIALAFLISVFFGKANISAACGGIIYFFTYLPYPITLWFEEQMSFSEKGLASLFSTTAFGMSFKYVARWEEQGIGAQWSNFYSNPMPSDTFSLGWATNFLILDTVLYLTLMWYFENVLPGEFGIPKPWYFPFTRTYWCGKQPKLKTIRSPRVSDSSMYLNYDQMDDTRSENSAMDDGFNPAPASRGNFESEPIGLKLGVSIKELVKIYSRGKKRAVDKLNLKMYEGQVTALLGHNGAGKSTTMSILTGLFPPTSGTAVVNGHDICTNIEEVRKSLGLCPQHNVLYDYLTVEEHMWFYGRLKGMSDKELPDEIEKFLKDVGLPEKRHELSCNLSGGMKRKLSVAMSFIAGSKTVILDEPTSGVDPYSRRAIWDLILKYKEGRSIMLSTHYMDEADLLGDRINIISKGKLQCSGTSLFLKRQFGKGYFLSVTKDNDNAEKFSVVDIGKFISSFIPGSKLHEDFGTESTFLLPSAARLTGEFTNLFENLEKSMDNFGIKNYGISDTTLEEVFLRACGDEDDDPFVNDDAVSLTGPVQSRRQPNGDTASLASVNSQIQLISDEAEESTSTSIGQDFSTDAKYWGPLLWLQQHKAILIKRFHHARRSRKGFFSQILLPAIFVILAMFVSLIRPPREGLPLLKMTTQMFGEPNHIVVNNLDVNKFSEKLFKNFVRNPGPDSCKKCYVSNPFNHKNITRWSPGPDNECSCETGKQQCPAGSYGPEPPHVNAANGDKVYDVTGRDMSDYLVKTTDDFVRQRYGAVSFGEHLISNIPDNVTGNFTTNNLVSSFAVPRNVKVWYNHKGYHALPVYLNTINNAILRASLDPSESPDDYGITSYNHPVDFNQDQVEDEVMRQGIVNLFVAIFVILALAFVPASFVVYLIEDRVTKSKHLQLVSGLNPVVYWLANFTWDLINYLIPATCCIIIFFAFNQKAYVSAQNFPPTLALLFLYGWSMTPLMYPCSFFFDVPSTAYIVLIALNLFVGIVGTIATFILDFFGEGDQELHDINVILKQVFLIFPNYCLGRGMMDLAGNQIKSEVYERFGAKNFKDPFAWDVTGRNILSMVFCGFLFFFITLLVQYRFFLKPWKSIVDPTPKEGEEEDVKNEKDKILKEEAEGQSYILKTNNLTKVYKNWFSSRKLLAVDRLVFGIKPGECFGLLGVNGAGKTSTFKMLTGDTHITAGDAFIKGHSVRNNLNDVRKYMGYCPQFDALDELLTGKELLVYYSQIRGMSKSDGMKMADWAIKTLGLTPHMDKLCGDYSGGNKRKLSTALALVGSPPLIFLDEPTTGMDPGARRFLWNVVSDLLKQGKSVVLTSHSMEECETLCTRLAIMVNGRFQCLGSPQHLRSKFGTGYTIIIRAKQNLVENVQDFIAANFVEAQIKDRHQYMLEYQVPNDNLKLSQVFHKLEMLRKTGSIDDYSVTQTTLDQIFVNFARNQVESVVIDDEQNELTDSQSNGAIRLNSWNGHLAVDV